jgi:uncharacterized protein YndB with AHSA1/START domain
MTDATVLDPFGRLIEPATFRIERLLPGPAERVWSYLTQSDLRREWLASGRMDMAEGSTFELVWHNDELTSPPGKRPAGFSEEHRMRSRIVEANPPHRLAFTWGETGEVSFELRPQGDQVLLTVTHRRITDRAMTLMVGAGWHMHLDILAARLRGTRTEPFWDGWLRLKDEYGRRLPA